MIKVVRLSKNQKKDLFFQFLVKSGYSVVSFSFDNELSTYIYVVESPYGVKQTIHAIIKSVSSSGWKSKQHIKRIQVKSYKTSEIPGITKTEVTVLCGLTFYDNEPVLVVWNIYSYMTQNTIRSCYLEDGLIEKTIKKGYYTTKYAGQLIYLCKSEYLHELLEQFISENETD